MEVKDFHWYQLLADLDVQKSKVLWRNPSREREREAVADLKETFGMINTGRGFDVDGADEKDVPSGMYLWGVDETEGQNLWFLSFQDL